MIRVLYHHDAGAWLSRRLESLGSEIGLEIVVVPPANRDLLTSLLPHADVLWHVLEPFTRSHIAAAKKLRLIQKIGVGVNTIDVDAATEQGIAVCNMPGSNSQAVAEMTIALMLACLRRLSFLDVATRRGDGWDLDADVGEESREIGCLTVGLVGYGAVPRALVPILQAFGARILCTARERRAHAEAEWVSLDELLTHSDVVSLHVPLTESTRRMIGVRELGMMKPGSVLINTSRGEVVDEGALVAALESRRLASAGLDVFAEEPVKDDNPILQLPNVVLTPHSAWHTRETFERSLAIAVENCRRLSHAEPLMHQVNEPGPA